MADIKWIKVSTDIWNNKKIKQIEALKNGDTYIVIWLKLLTLAGTINDNGYIYVEFSGLTITYGHYPGHCAAGKTYTVKPTLIYTKGGKQYKVTITINMKF